MSKGSKQRPIEDRSQFEKNWERIFNRPSSPCVEVCELDFSNNICRGCHRTLAEIEAWGHCNEDEKARIMRNVEERKNAKQVHGKP